MPPPPHRLFLPPISPDLNPIEQVFAKLKHLLRNAAERTEEVTWRRSGNLLDPFPPEECANDFQNAERRLGFHMTSSLSRLHK